MITNNIKWLIVPIFSTLPLRHLSVSCHKNEVSNLLSNEADTPLDRNRPEIITMMSEEEGS